ncbi:MAG: DnaA N-terminal domain-containing protein [Planctomycetota bacterium]
MLFPLPASAVVTAPRRPHCRIHQTVTTATVQASTLPASRAAQRDAALPTDSTTTLPHSTDPAAREAPSSASIERRLAARIGAARYRMWFAEPACLSLNGSELVVDASSPFAAEWIERNFRDLLNIFCQLLDI